MKLSQKLQPLLFSIFTLAILVYLTLRAINSGLVNDESFTFFRYISSNRPMPFIWGDHISANNHILNSLLAWCTFKVFGISELIIRLPNLLSFILYAYSLYHIGQLLSKKYLRILFWLLAFGAHYYIEFFAYSRGYGLSLALLAASLLSLLKSTDSKNAHSIKHLWISFWLLSLATLANLNLFLSLLIWIVPAFLLLQKKSVAIKAKRKLGITFMVTVAIFTSLALILREGDHLSFGQNDLLASIQSLLIEFTGNDSNHSLWIATAVIITMILFSVLRLVKLPLKTVNAFQIFAAFFSLNVLGIIMMHYILGVNYPLGRTGFQVYFFFICTLPFLIDQFGTRIKLAVTLTCILLFTPMFWFSIQVSNLYYSSNAGWREQQISDEFFYQIQELNQQPEFPLSLYASDNFYTVNLAFKNLKLGGNLPICMNAGPATLITSSDLLIMKEEQFPEYGEWYQRVFRDSLSGMSLMKRNPLLETFFITDSVVPPNSPSSGNFTPIARMDLPDGLDHKPIRLNFSTELQSQGSPFLGIITIEVWDSTQQIGFDFINLDYYQDDISDGYHFKTSSIFNQLMPGAKEIRCYIWNLDKTPFTILNSRTTVFELKLPVEKTVAEAPSL